MTKLKYGRHTSELKSLRKSRKKEKINKFVKDKIHFLSRKIKDEVKKKKSATVKKLLSDLISQCDKATKRGVLHMNAAARKKSKMMKLVHLSAK